MKITQADKDDILNQPAVRRRGQELLNELYTHFEIKRGWQPTHKQVVALAEELLTRETK